MDWQLFSRAAAKKVCSNLSIKTETLQKIKQASEVQIRDLETSQAVAGVQSMLFLCTSLYMGVQPPDKDDEDKIMLYQKAASFIISKFPFLGVDEIDQAFALYSVGTFPKVDLNAYYGTFSIDAIGKLLTQYKIYRNRILSAVAEEIEKKRKAEEEEANRDMKNAEAQAEFCKEVLKWVAMTNEGFPPFEDWREIPSIKAEAAFKHKALIFQGDKKALWAKAGNLAKQEIERELRADIEQGRKGVASLKNLLKIFEEGQKPRNYDGVRTKIYSQLLLWSFVKPKNND